MAPLLELRNITLSFQLYEGVAHVLDGLNLQIGRGERVGLVGESGCGKSLTARTILGLTAARNASLGGDIVFDGQVLNRLSERDWRALRGRRITMIFQDPTAALNPVFTIADQMVEVIRRDPLISSRHEALEKAREGLRKVSITEPDRVLGSYPFQLSGGMAQRVVITMALAANPDLVLADEPGTALDVTVQEQTLRLMATLTSQSNSAVLLIAHNLGVVREFCQRVCVMYAGTIVEEGLVSDVFNKPLHPYTQALFAAVPRLTGGDLPKTIEGALPNYVAPPRGCRFQTRCPHVRPECSEQVPWVEVADSRHVRCTLYRTQDDK